MTCPVCSSVMTESRRGALLIDQCPHCRHLWFDGSELERYARSRRVYDDVPHITTGRPDSTQTQQAFCPRCGPQVLQSGTWLGIPMAVCSRCEGILLAPDALRAVRATFGRTARPDFQEPSSDDGTWDLIDHLLASDT